MRKFYKEKDEEPTKELTDEEVFAIIYYLFDGK